MWFCLKSHYQCLCCLFNLFIVSFEAETFSMLNFNLSMYSLVACGLCTISKKILAYPRHEDILRFSFKSVTIIAFLLKLMTLSYFLYMI